MKFRLFLFASLVFAVSIVSAITSAQRRPETDKPLSGDFKITFKQTVSGNSIQNTTMIKGQRERSETSVSAGAYTMSTVNIGSKRNKTNTATAGSSSSIFERAAVINSLQPKCPTARFFGTGAIRRG